MASASWARKLFFSDAETPLLMLSLAICALPVDKLFSTFYECEAAAKSGEHVGPNGRVNVGLLESLAASDGILHKTHSAFSAVLFAMDSPLGVRPLAEACGAYTRCWKRARAIHVRLSALFSYHFLGTFWQPQFKFIDILSYNDHDGLIRINRFMHPEEHHACTGCEGLFLRRL